MEPVTLRLTTFVNGAEKASTWTFTPLRNQCAYRLARQASESGNGRLRRRPLAEREVRSLKLAAGMLLDDVQWDHLRTLLHAHKIEWQREVAGKPAWIQFDLDIEQDVQFENLEDIDRLRSITIKLVQTNPMWYTDFQNPKVQFTDYQG